MSRQQYFYDVLDTDTSKDVVRNANTYQEARFVLQTEDGREVTLVASMNSRGDWGLTIEDEARRHLYETGGNALVLSRLAVMTSDDLNEQVGRDGADLQDLLCEYGLSSGEKQVITQKVLDIMSATLILHDRDVNHAV